MYQPRFWNYVKIIHPYKVYLYPYLMANMEETDCEEGYVNVTNLIQEFK